MFSFVSAENVVQSKNWSEYWIHFTYFRQFSFYFILFNSKINWKQLKSLYCIFLIRINVEACFLLHISAGFDSNKIHMFDKFKKKKDSCACGILGVLFEEEEWNKRAESKKRERETKKIENRYFSQCTKVFYRI